MYSSLFPTTTQNEITPLPFRYPKDVRSAVDAIIKWHRPFHSPDLTVKLERLTASPFCFFRGTYFLYTSDLSGPFREPKPLDDRGRVIGDLHTENYGTFRAVTGEIVYDINDFDETTIGFYEYDARRLAVSLILASLENGHRLGDGLNAAEAAVRSWIDSLHRWSKLRRKDFETLQESRQVRGLLATAGEKSRAEFLKSLSQQATPGKFVFRLTPDLHPVADKERKNAVRALPFFLKHCLAPAGAHLELYQFQDVASRTAGNGSLGRVRYAVLLDKGQKKQDATSLRLVEWKQSLDSSLDSAKPRCTQGRAREVYQAALAFQLFPKRYLGYTHMAGMEMQTRELGANDARFSHKAFVDVTRFQDAAAIFGSILARCHLLASPGKGGPRRIPQHVSDPAGRHVDRILQFAAAYVEQVHLDLEELRKRRGEVERAWSQ